MTPLPPHNGHFLLFPRLRLWRGSTVYHSGGLLYFQQTLIRGSQPSHGSVPAGPTHVTRSRGVFFRRLYADHD